MKFRKIVSIDNTGLEPWAKEKLLELAEEVVLYEDYPTSNSEIISRIEGSDCVLVSWNTPIDREVIESCSSIKYIGMCCSLYDEKSANVDIVAARENGIKVLGIKDYGDEGVIEFILGELIRLFHGFGGFRWQDEPIELTDQKLGIIGLGATHLPKYTLVLGEEEFQAVWKWKDSCKYDTSADFRRSCLSGMDEKRWELCDF